MTASKLSEFDKHIAELLFSDKWKMFSDDEKHCRLLNVFKLKQKYMDNHTITGAFDVSTGSGQRSLLSCLREQHRHRRGRKTYGF